MKKSTIRRSVTIPTSLDDRINLLQNDFSYKVKNDLIIELLELGIIKFSEDNKLENRINTLLNKIDLLVSKLENK